MAEILFQNAFKIAALTLNYVSPSVLADVVLHPFDFATVLLQIGYNPEGIKDETATFVSVFIQYALFTLYIPYLLTSMQGLQIMGMPHPSIFYYVSYIYKKEGLGGCYRGLTPKIIERLVMIHINDSVKQVINRGPSRRTVRINRDQLEEDQFLKSLINNICCQFFAVLASHPFHVIMITSFADFVYNRRNTLYQLAILIYKRDGYYGFTIGLAPRLVGELLSLIFSMVYTRIITKQVATPRQREPIETGASANLLPEPRYFPELNRSLGIQEEAEKERGGRTTWDLSGEASSAPRSVRFSENLPENENERRGRIGTRQDRSVVEILLDYVPLTSKFFYHVIMRDYIAKKISHPFFLVCHCMIVLDTGWEKLPLIPYVRPMVKFVHVFVPRRNRLDKPL